MVVVDYISKKALEKLGSRLSTLADGRKAELSSLSEKFAGIQSLREFYVEPDCQLQNPEEYESGESSSGRTPVLNKINEFIKEERSYAETGNQLFVLGDAGMGKTSLLVMLKVFHIARFWPTKHECCLMKLGNESLGEIEKLKNKGETVLLLDALDEDPLSFNRIRERTVELLKATKNFWRVIITSRSAYLEGDPDELFGNPGWIMVDGFRVQRIFLSFFSDQQVTVYLKNRFRKDRSNLEKAKEVASKMHTLQLRPLLLSYIENLVESPYVASGWSEYNIFDALVNSWLIREERKLKEMDNDASARTLLSACLHLAYRLHATPERNMNIYELEDMIERVPEMSGLSALEIGGRSLLHRTTEGAYQFAHFSIQEFLCVMHAASGARVESEGAIRVTDLMLKFLAEVDLSNKTLIRWDFSGCDISSLTLEDVSFQQCVFCDATANGCALAKSVFEWCRFEGDFENASFENARFQDCAFDEGNFVGVVWDGAEAVTCTGYGAKFSQLAEDLTSLLEIKGAPWNQNSR